MAQGRDGNQGSAKVQTGTASPLDGFAGAEVERLAREYAALLEMLARQRGNDLLKEQTDTFIQGQRKRLNSACVTCAENLMRCASSHHERPKPIELPVSNRRTDFVLRLVLAFYPHGLSNRLSGQCDGLQLPRANLGRIGRFLQDLLGSVLYADLNADCARLLSRFPTVADQHLRDAMFQHPPSRALLMKVLVRLLSGFQDLPLARSIFVRHVALPTTFDHTGQRRRSADKALGDVHFRALCEGLFGDFLVQLQSPQEGDTLDAWFGVGATSRVLDLLDSLTLGKLFSEVHP